MRAIAKNGPSDQGTVRFLKKLPKPVSLIRSSSFHKRAVPSALFELRFPNIFSKARDIAALFSRIRLKSIVLSIVFDSSSRLHIRDRPRRSSKKNDVRFRGDEESSLEKKKIKERSRD
jgi:hypothetical protein